MRVRKNYLAIGLRHPGENGNQWFYHFRLGKGQQ